MSAISDQCQPEESPVYGAGVLSRRCYDAVVLDLDGVITQTAEQHARAWQRTFDDFLSARDGQHEPFDIDADYRRFVDGKPRYQGVQSFLESRKINLPYGDPDDVPGDETVCGLGNRKNQRFLELLRTDGVRVFPSSLVFVRALRRAGFAVAVASSSRNCEAVLEAAGIQELFDVRVDGLELERLGLAGKPAPDMFSEALRRLHCEPQRAVGIEDAEAGVRALKAAGFGRVIGMASGEQAAALGRQHADLVVAELGQLRVVFETDTGVPAASLPSALDCFDEVVSGQRELALFLDYDGTLTPIVERPEDAVLPASMSIALKRLAGLCKLAIVSGRDLDDVRNKVGLVQLWYCGSHGFDIAGPQGQQHQHPEAVRYLALLDTLERDLEARLAGLPGCLVERKRFAIAVHYRQVDNTHLDQVCAQVRKSGAAHPDLRLSTGKKIFEFQPNLDWHKGRAVRWLMETLTLDPARVKPLYMGDDVTDEDAFHEVRTDGLGIVVDPEVETTFAAYRLEDAGEVEAFLAQLGAYLEDSNHE